MAKVHRFVGRIVVVGQVAFHLCDLHIVNLVVLQHGSSNFRTACAIGHWHLSVFSEFAFQNAAQDKTNNHEQDADNQHSHVLNCFFDKNDRALEAPVLKRGV
jgi:hypothetical protein